ncbi:MAG: hypothetical protein AB7I48_17140 [Planctomycetaceae bacterium]
MNASLAILLVLLLTASYSYAEDGTDTKASGGVPKSVLEALGLGSLVVDAAEEVPEDTPADGPVAASPDDAGRPLSAESEAHAAQAAAKQAASREAVAKEAAAQEAAAKTAADVEATKQRLAALEQEAAQAEADSQQAQQQLVDAQTAAQAAEKTAAQALQSIAAFAAEGQVVADEYNTQSNLVKGLSTVHGELNKLAETSGDAGIVKLQTDVGKLLADRQQSHADMKQVLTDKVQQFSDLKTSLLAAQRDAEEKRNAVDAAEADAAQRAAALDAAREQLRTALLTPPGPRDDLPQAEPDSAEPSATASATTPD